MKSMVVKVPRSKVMLYPITVSLELVAKTTINLPYDILGTAEQNDC